MSLGFDPLEGQLELYAVQTGNVDRGERLAAELKPALCDRANEQVSFGLHILQRIRLRAERWGQGVEAGEVEFRWSESEGLAQMFRKWKEDSEQVLELLRACESMGLAVERSDEFRREFKDVCLMALDVPRVKQSIESLEAGRGIPLSQAILPPLAGAGKLANN